MTRPRLSAAEGGIVRPPEGHSTATTPWPQITRKKVGLPQFHNPDTITGKRLYRLIFLDI